MKCAKLLAPAIVAGLPAFLATIGPSTAVAATSAVVVSGVKMRAGPSTGYPVVVSLPANAALTVYGCTARTTWCDVNWGRDRGWVAASYVRVAYQGSGAVVTPAVAQAIGLTVVAFDRAYWDAYYVGRPWYGQWNAYGPVPYGRAVTGCVDGACGGAIAGPGHAAAGYCADGTCRGAGIRRGPFGGLWFRHGSISRG